MKTTLELPDTLMREVKIRAVEEGRTLGEEIARLLRAGLDHEAPAEPIEHRVSLPLIESTGPGTALSPDELARMLLDQEIEQATR